MDKTTYKYQHTKTDKFDYPHDENGEGGGIGGSLWTVITNCEDPNCECDECGAGLCFDFGEDNVDSIIKGLQDWKTKEHTVYEEDKEYQEYVDKCDERESKWWYKVWDWANDLSLTIRPFGWDFYFKVKPEFNLFFSLPSSRSRGFSIGPLQVVTPRFGKKKRSI